MEEKPIQSRRIRKPNSVNRIESIQVIWDNQDGERTLEHYKLIRGSAVWPHESWPGIVLLGGQRLNSEQLLILEERPFQCISGAVEVFDELWNYSPSRYYSEESQENQGFINFLRRTKSLQGKIPFVPAPHSAAINYGNQLIADFLESGRLVIPSNGILMTQIQEGRQDTSIEEVYAITALRYLLAGINAHPWEEEPLEISFERCLN